MPGSTDNSTILAAANQIIVALNEISTKITGGDGEALSRIGDLIEAQSTMLEARSVAETEAQNTNFAELIDAVDNINLSVDTGSLVAAIQACCANVNTNLGLMIAAIRAIRLVTTGGGGGTPGVTGGPYLDPPPIIPGANDPPLVDLAKCQAANYIHWAITSSLRSIASWQNLAYDLTKESNVTTIIAGLLVALGFLTLPLSILEAIAIGVVGLLVAVGNKLILVYFGYLADSLDQDKQEIICNLYGAGSADEARNYIHGLIDSRIDAVAAIPVEGLTPLSSPVTLILKNVLAEVAKSLAANYLVNVLFDPSPEVEAAEIPGALECDGCGSCGFNWDFTADNGGFVSQGSTEFNCGTSDVGYELEFPGWYLDITTQNALPGCTMAVYIKKTDISVLASGIAVAGALQTPGQNSGIQYRIIGTQGETPYDSGEISTGQVFGSEAHQFDFPAGDVLVSEVWIGISGTGFGGAPNTHSVIRLTSLGLIC